MRECEFSVVRIEMNSFFSVEELAFWDKIGVLREICGCGSREKIS